VQGEGGVLQKAPKTLQSEHIAERLEEEIIAGRLRGGARLDEASIAARFGVSRTPVREALQLLCGRSLAERAPWRGVLVSTLPPERIDLMFEAMAEIEAVCARLASQRMTPSERAGLEDLHRRMDEMAAAGDVEGYAPANTDFHSRIIEGCHNRDLVAMANSMRVALAGLRRYQLRDAGRIRRSSREHGAIVAGLAAGDPAATAAAIRRHLGSAAQQVIEKRRQEGLSDDG
jgi:DNA-binding GntR family transcriptional regulator